MPPGIRRKSTARTRLKIRAGGDRHMPVGRETVMTHEEHWQLSADSSLLLRADQVIDP
jgi:hypothetical protein